MPGKRENYLSWSEYSMGIALLASLRSKDPSTQVGAYIVRDNKPLSIGYNGLTVGMNDDEFYWDSRGEKTGDIYTTKNPYVAHAEANAILNYKGDLTNATIYVTLFPCNECAKLIIQAGIKEVVYLRMYSKDDLVKITKKMFDAAGVSYRPYSLEHDFTKKEVKDLSYQMQNIIKSFEDSKESNLVSNLEIDEYFMKKAQEESKFSTCRRHVGAVFVRDNQILVTGYNGAPNGVKSCQELDGCMRENDHIKSGTMQEHCKAIHAEQRAITRAAKNGISISDSTLYVTTYPCAICARMLIDLGVREIVYDGDYLDKVSHSLIEEAKIPTRKIGENPVKKMIYNK